MHAGPRAGPRAHTRAATPLGIITMEQTLPEQIRKQGRVPCVPHHLHACLAFAAAALDEDHVLA